MHLTIAEAGTRKAQTMIIGIAIGVVIGWTSAFALVKWAGVIGKVRRQERESCAKICDEGAAKNDGDAAAVLMTAADLIRNPVE